MLAPGLADNTVMGCCCCCTQTLLYTHDVDPYYKLALLSYRSKLQNMELVKVG